MITQGANTYCPGNTTTDCTTSLVGSFPAAGLTYTLSCTNAPTGGPPPGGTATATAVIYGISTLYATADILGLALDGSDVYWADDTSLKILKHPQVGAGTTTLASNLSNPTYLAVNGTDVYWTDQSANTVMKVVVGGGQPQPSRTA